MTDPTDPLALLDSLGASDIAAVAGVLLGAAARRTPCLIDGTDADDIGNATNRSPWPTLQLLREASIDRAVASIPDPDAIYEANIRTLEDLGTERWADLMATCRRDAGR